MEIKRWRLRGGTRGAPGPMQEDVTVLVDGGPVLPYCREVEVMPVEDHQHLLQAEAEAEAEGKDERITEQSRRREAAESRLSSVEAELKIERDRMYKRIAKAVAKGLPITAAYLRGKQNAYHRALQLLRDKGTEQGESR